jgi:phosphotransacetylase
MLHLPGPELRLHLLQTLGVDWLVEVLGPILIGMKKPVHVLQRGDDVTDIVNMAAVTVVDA